MSGSVGLVVSVVENVESCALEVSEVSGGLVAKGEDVSVEDEGEDVSVEDEDVEGATTAKGEAEGEVVTTVGDEDDPGVTTTGEDEPLGTDTAKGEAGDAEADPSEEPPSLLPSGLGPVELGDADDPSAEGDGVAKGLLDEGEGDDGCVAKGEEDAEDFAA